MRTVTCRLKALLFLLLAAPACFAGTFTLSTTDDSGSGSLREAIVQDSGPSSFAFGFAHRQLPHGEVAAGFQLEAASSADQTSPWEKIDGD